METPLRETVWRGSALGLVEPRDLLGGRRQGGPKIVRLCGQGRRHVGRRHPDRVQLDPVEGGGVLEQRRVATRPNRLDDLADGLTHVIGRSPRRAGQVEVGPTADVEAGEQRLVGVGHRAVSVPAPVVALDHCDVSAGGRLRNARRRGQPTACVAGERSRYGQRRGTARGRRPAWPGNARKRKSRRPEGAPAGDSGRRIPVVAMCQVAGTWSSGTLPGDLSLRSLPTTLRGLSARTMLAFSVDDGPFRCRITPSVVRFATQRSNPVHCYSCVTDRSFGRLDRGPVTAGARTRPH